MKIAHVLLSLNPDYGGPAASAQSLAVAQAMAGHEVSIYLPITPNTQTDISKAIQQCPALAHVRIATAPALRATALSILSRSSPPTMHHLAGLDFIHIHDLWQPFLAQAAVLATRSAIPYAVSPHGTLNSWSLAQKPVRKRLALALLWRRLLARAAFVHALNETEAAEIRSLGLHSKIVIAPNGAFLVPPEALPQPGTFRRMFRLSPTRPFVLFLGRLHTNKGVDLLVDAFQQLSARFSDVDLVIAGPDEGTEAALRQQVAARGLDARVFFTGPVYGADKLAAYVDATVFCLPSRGEAFSMAVVEAMAAGAPVVITSRCNFPEAAAADAGLVCEVSAEGLADSLAHMLESPALRYSCAAKARRLIAMGYSWEGVAQRIIARYEAAHLQRAAQTRHR